jgi:hypothetical protein
MDVKIAQVHASPSRAVELVMIQKVVGIVVHITDTSTLIRAVLNYTVRSLTIRNGFQPGSSGRSGAAFLIKCRAKGVEAPASVYLWPSLGQLHHPQSQRRGGVARALARALAD